MGRRSRGSFGVVLAIVLGLIGGIVFMMRDSQSDTSAEAVTQVVMPTLDQRPTTIPSLEAPPVEASQTYQLLIPTADIHAPIIQVPFVNDTGTWDVHMLGINAGHLRRTAWLDDSGNMVIIGHVELADGSPGPFAELSILQAGALIYIVDSTNDPIRTYRVTETRATTPNDISVLYSTSEDRLTLITCGSYDFLSNSYLQRIVTIASRVL